MMSQIRDYEPEQPKPLQENFDFYANYHDAHRHIPHDEKPPPVGAALAAMQCVGYAIAQSRLKPLLQEDLRFSHRLLAGTDARPAGAPPHGTDTNVVLTIQKY